MSARSKIARAGCLWLCLTLPHIVSAQVREGAGETLVKFLSPAHVICDSGCTAVGTANVNVAQIGGNAVTTTLPVSGTVTFANTSLAVTNAGVFAVQAAQSGTWNLGTLTSITNPVAVTGTFFQATQPVSGTFFQATQPVSGTVTVTDGAGALNVIVDSGTTTVTQGTAANLNATVVGTGTFVAQVTGTVTTAPPSNASTNIAQMNGTTVSMNTGVRDAGTQRVTIATNDAVPVTGTFFQATQPVSGTVTVTDGAGALNVIVDSGAINATLAAETTKVIGTVNIAASQTVGLVAGAAIVGKVGIDQTTPGTTNRVDVGVFPDNEPFNVAQFGGTNVVTGTGASGSGIPRVTVANDSAVITTPPTLTKGTQGATGYSVQALKDAGRVAKSFYANNVASGTSTTETLITLTQSSGTGATASAASYTITSGKTFHVVALSVGSRGNATATVQSTIFNLRMNTGGACIVSSTPILFAAQSATPAVISAWDRVILPIPDGYEIAGNGTISICLSAAATFATNAPTWSVNLIGFEY